MNRELVVRRLAAAAAGALLLGGCTSGGAAELEVASEEPGGDDQGSTGDTSDPAESAPAEPAGSEGTDDPDDPGGTDTTERELAWPDPIAVDVVGRHAGGLVVELFEVSSVASSVDVDVRITNGQSSLSARMTEILDPTRLVDDTGIEYVLVPPETEGLFEVAKGEVMEGTLTFSGPLSPDATSLTFFLNPAQVDEDQTRERAIPHLVMEIPLIDGSRDDPSAGDDVEEDVGVEDDADVEDDAGTDAG